MTAPIASGWSDCRVGFSPTGKRRLCTAHAKCRHRYIANDARARLPAVHLRVSGLAINFATARAELMNNWASGLGVRFLTVMTSTEPSTVGTLTGNILSPTRLALNRATEPGSSPTNLPVAIIVVVN